MLGAVANAIAEVFKFLTQWWSPAAQRQRQHDALHRQLASLRSQRDALLAIDLPTEADSVRMATVLAELERVQQALTTPAP